MNKNKSTNLAESFIDFFESSISEMPKKEKEKLLGKDCFKKMKKNL